MELREIEKLEPGDFVKYIGPKTKRSMLQTGNIYEVSHIRPDCEEFLLKIGLRIGHSPFGIEWDVSSFERVEQPIQLKPTDYLFLIDYALDKKDRAWFMELCNKYAQQGI